MVYVEVDQDVRVYVQDAGSGTPVVAPDQFDAALRDYLAD